MTLQIHCFGDVTVYMYVIPENWRSNKLTEGKAEAQE